MNHWTRLGASLALLASSCSGGNTASSLATPPEYRPAGQTKCGVTASQARPLIVEWPSSDRATLEAQVKQGLVAVRYEGCEMEVLSQCRAPGAYGYTGLTRKDDHLAIHDADELYASVPVHAAKLEGKLQKSGQLDVAMTIVGRYAAERSSVRRAELSGECGRATHLITALTAGAFEFFAGADAAVSGGASIARAGAGARSSAGRELLNRDGEKAACEKAAADEKAPPFGCGALIRIEVTPIALSLAERLVGDWELVGSPRPLYEAIARKAAGGDATKEATLLKSFESMTNGFTSKLWVHDDGQSFTVFLDGKPVSRGRYETLKEEGDKRVVRQVGPDEITHLAPQGTTTIVLLPDGTTEAYDEHLDFRSIHRRR